jgi:hypothetical protein
MQMSDFACAAPYLSSGSSGTSNLERDDRAQPGPPAVIDGLRSDRQAVFDAEGAEVILDLLLLLFLHPFSASQRLRVEKAAPVFNAEALRS